MQYDFSHVQHVPDSFRTLLSAWVILLHTASRHELATWTVLSMVCLVNGLLAGNRLPQVTVQPSGTLLGGQSRPFCPKPETLGVSPSQRTALHIKLELVLSKLLFLQKEAQCHTKIQALTDIRSDSTLSNIPCFRVRIIAQQQSFTLRYSQCWPLG